MSKIRSYTLRAAGACAALALGLSSCNKFLDIQPKGTLPADVQFSTLKGYEDAMYGVYGTLAGSDLYGKALTFGLADQLGQMLGQLGQVDREAYNTLNYVYDDAAVRSRIETTFSQLYIAISNVNSVLSHAASPSFENRHLATIRGEALGVRALLHLEVLRLFARNYSLAQQAGGVTEGIPYSYDYDLKNKQVFTLQESYQRVLRDLDEAEALLASDESIQPSSPEQTDFYANRTTHFNKYAVYAIKARTYRLMRDYTNAARYARLVTEHKADFALVDRNSYTSRAVTFPATGEMIFGLWAPRQMQLVADYLLSQAGSGNIVEGRRAELLQSLYSSSAGGAGATDLRLGAFYRNESGAMRFIRFLADASTVNNVEARYRGIALLRLPEMYYILAEALYDSDRSGAYAALNAVRLSRGLDEYSGTEFASREAFEEELMKEYMREYAGEGQVFASLKHYNRPFVSITGDQTFQPSDQIFVLPWPLSERQLGNRIVTR